MIPELGQFTLIAALILSLWQALHQPVAQRLNMPALTLCAPRLAMANGLLVTAAFACLIISYARSDFTVLSVILNSHSLKPLWYKITGSWGNHEGSMLLWAWVLAFLGLILGSITKAQPRSLHHDTLSVLGFISAGFLLFILLTSNPFIRVFPPPLDGEDLNPLLQDIGLIIHPPLLYLGYVGSGIVFAFAAAAMWRRKIDSTLARTMQPWLLATWSALSAGIAVGSWWAYRELGWGGWWYWDPVENVSLMPWLCATALLHCNVVLEKRGELGRMVALLAIITFSLSLTGTFIVRSGLITSVHAFASDPTRGMFMLALIALVILSGLLLFARMQWPDVRAGFSLASRQGQIVLASITLLTLAATILLAILYPLMLTLMKLPTISVGPPYFHAVFVPLALPMAVLAACAPFVPWQSVSRDHLKKCALWFALPCAVALIISLSILHTQHAMTISAVALSAGVMFSMVRLLKMQYRTRFSLRNMATFTGHSGFAFLLIACAINAQFKTHIEAPLRVGDQFSQSGITVLLKNVQVSAHNNYLRRTATLTLSKNNTLLATLQPETRFYPVRAQETSESAVFSTWTRDLYTVIGRANYAITPEAAHSKNAENQPLGVRVYIMPAQRLIWLSFGLIALSGVLGAAGHIRKANATCA